MENSAKFLNSINEINYAMKAAVFYGKEDIRVEEKEIPEINDDEVLIKVSYCGICGSDLTAFRTGNYVLGTVIGHEFSGIVEKAGKNVTGVTEGNRVTGASIIPCGNCSYCLSGKPNLCRNSQLTGITINGAFAEFVKLPSKAVFRIPDNLEMKYAALTEPLSIVVHALYESDYRDGISVLVQGAGPIGLLLVSLLSRSAQKILVSEISEKRLELARKINNSIITINPARENIFSKIDMETDGEGIDMIFDTTGSPKSVISDFTLVRRGGEIIHVGIPEEKCEADFFTTVVNEITIKGAYESFNEIPVAINLLSEKKVDGSKIITSTINLDEIVEKGFRNLLENPGEGKILVKIGGDE